MIHWASKHFTELTNLELYKILQLRIDVFMLEQNCLYPECDDKDLVAKHVFAATDSFDIIAYCRLIPKEISYPEVSIGRVVISNKYRGQKLGYLLMEKAILELEQDNPQCDIRISAQAHLELFYTNLGFKKVSEVYLEDDIPHIEMLKTAGNKKEE